MRNTFDGLIRRLDIAKEMSCELDYKSIENSNIKNKEERKDEKK